MVQKLCMGNQAMGLAALAAGVQLVSGYPGTPSTEVLETIARENDGSIHVEWSVNEKVALEVAAGASYTGARTLVTMKQVGLNVATDPLMSLAYIGVAGGMVVLVADDPGPISSQTEQDTRHFAAYAHLPVLDPSSPEEAYEMMLYAYELSEAYRLPVLLRPTTRICHACATLEVGERPSPRPVAGFQKSPDWVIFPRLSLRKHQEMEEKQHQLAATLSQCVFNRIEGEGRLGVAASGIAYAYAKEAILNHNWPVRLLKVGAAHPFPTALAREFLAQVDRVLVLEELDGVVENELWRLVGQDHLPHVILGKESGHLPFAGEYSYEIAAQALGIYVEQPLAQTTQAPASPVLPGRPPVLCAGCPHRASFYGAKRAFAGQKAVFTGDIGCYTLGNAPPLDMVDTCLCMGAGLTIAQGLEHMEPDVQHVAFIGDSTFLHTGIPGVINAVYNQAELIIVLLDNSTTAMTGHQPHPGTGQTMMNQSSPPIEPTALLRACNVPYIVTVDPLDLEKTIAAFQAAAAQPGVKAIICQSPCIALEKPTAHCVVGTDCSGCQHCIQEIGCPAIHWQATVSQAAIDPALCTGCGLCSQICPLDCISKEAQS